MTSLSGLEPGDEAPDFSLKNANLNVGSDTMNLKKEIITQNEFVREWGGKFIVPIPDTEIL